MRPGANGSRTLLAGPSNWKDVNFLLTETAGPEE